MASSKKSVKEEEMKEEEKLEEEIKEEAQPSEAKEACRHAKNACKHLIHKISGGLKVTAGIVIGAVGAIAVGAFMLGKDSNQEETKALESEVEPLPFDEPSALVPDSIE